MLDDEEGDEEEDIEGSEDELISAPVTPSRRAQHLLQRATAHLKKKTKTKTKTKHAQQAGRDTAEQQRVEKSVDIGFPVPLSQIHPSSSNTKRLSPASSTSDRHYKKSKYNMGKDDPDDEGEKEKKAALHDAVTLDYIDIGPNMWDEKLVETVDRHWREIFAPRPSEQLDMDLVYQVSTHCCRELLTIVQAKALGLSIEREEAVCKARGTPMV